MPVLKCELPAPIIRREWDRLAHAFPQNCVRWDLGRNVTPHCGQAIIRCVRARRACSHTVEQDTFLLRGMGSPQSQKFVRFTAANVVAMQRGVQ